jgi:hypothetical protein
MLKCAPYSAADPMHVDPWDALPAARELAQSLDRRSVFCNVHLIGAVDGVVAVGTDPLKFLGMISFGFEAGSRAIDVVLQPGQLAATEGRCKHAAPVPACTPNLAARAVLASGVPPGTRATMIYNYDKGAARPRWFFTSENNRYMRWLDGRTCAITLTP